MCSLGITGFETYEGGRGSSLVSTRMNFHPQKNIVPATRISPSKDVGSPNPWPSTIPNPCSIVSRWRMWSLIQTEVGYPQESFDPKILHIYIYKCGFFHDPGRSGNTTALNIPSISINDSGVPFLPKAPRAPFLKLCKTTRITSL